MVKLMGILLHFFSCMCWEVGGVMATAPTNITTVFAKEVHNVLLILSCFCHRLTSAPDTAVRQHVHYAAHYNNNNQLFHMVSELFLGKVNVVCLWHDNMMSYVLLKTTYWQLKAVFRLGECLLPSSWKRD